MGNAARVGAFVTAFVVLLIAAYAVLGQRFFTPKTNRYFAVFDDVNGVTPGTPVLMAGVKVGQVDKVDLAGPRQARLTLSVEPTTPVPTGTTAVVPTSLIGFGSAPITLTPPATDAAPLPPESTIPGHKASPLDAILPDSKQTVAEVNKLLVEIRKLVADGKFKEDVHGLLANTNQTVAKFGALANHFDALLTRNQAQIDTAILQGSKAVANVQRITYQVADLLQKGTFQNDAHAILTQLKATSKKADQLVASMNSLVNEPSLRNITGNVAQITSTGKDIAANVADITNTGKSIAKNADAVTKNGVEISKNIVDVTAKVKTVTDNAIDIEKSVKELLDKVNGVVGKGAKGPKLPDVTTNLDLAHSQDLDRFRTDLTASVALEGGHVDLGLWDAFEGNKLILQYGKDVNSAWSYRYGIFASKPGFGVDYRLSPRVTLRNDVWDLNRLRYDPSVRYNFGGGIVGWVGLERAFDRSAPIFGIGISR